MMESYEELIWIYNDKDSNGNHHLQVMLEEEEEQDRRNRRTFLFAQFVLGFMFLSMLIKSSTLLYKKEKSEMKNENKVYDNHYYEQGFRQYYIVDYDKTEKEKSQPSKTENHIFDDNSRDRDVFSSKVVERIAVIGERNSKVSDVASHLVRCFPEVEVATSLARLGHWFQDELLEFSKNPTLVVSTFLNVYDWVELMRTNPLHAPNHENMDWRTFLTTPWTMNRSKYDLQFESQDKLCQWGFNYSEVIPCILSSKGQKDPVYELKRDGSGLPFENILNFRAEKIRNFLDTKNYKNVHGFVTVKYEDLIKKEGFKRLVERITSETGIQSQCDSSEISLPMPIESNIAYDKKYIDWINEEADWLAEMKIKYKMDEMFQFPEEKNLPQSINKTKTEEKNPPQSINKTKSENPSPWTNKKSNNTSSLPVKPKGAKNQANRSTASPSKASLPTRLIKDAKIGFIDQSKRISVLPETHLRSNKYHRNFLPIYSYKKDQSKIINKKQSP